MFNRQIYFCVLALATAVCFSAASWSFAQMPTAADSPLDPAIALLTKARERFQGVQDYECRLFKQERVKGKLLPQGTALMKVRNEPLSIYLRCESPDSERGMEVCYVANRNKGMMRVHLNGLFGIFGYLTLSPTDSRALAKSRHSITEAGLGNLLDSTAKYWEKERSLNKTRVEISDDMLGGRACTRIITIHPDRDAEAFYGYRCILWLDKETLLPLGAETFDWPATAASGEGELLERYRFTDIRCNIRFSDAVFEH